MKKYSVMLATMLMALVVALSSCKDNDTAKLDELVGELNKTLNSGFLEESSDGLVTNGKCSREGNNIIVNCDMKYVDFSGFSSYEIEQLKQTLKNELIVEFKKDKTLDSYRDTFKKLKSEMTFVINDDYGNNIDVTFPLY